MDLIKVRAKVRGINKAILDHCQKGCGTVFCEVAGEENACPFVYEVLGARSRKGVFQVKTINGWKTPCRVFVQPIA
jgi:hypothetical protein